MKIDPETEISKIIDDLFFSCESHRGSSCISAYAGVKSKIEIALKMYTFLAFF